MVEGIGMLSDSWHGHVLPNKPLGNGNVSHPLTKKVAVCGNRCLRLLQAEDEDVNVLLVCTSSWRLNQKRLEQLEEYLC